MLSLDQLGSVNRGKSKHRPRNDPSLYGGEYPFVQTGDIKHSHFYVTNHTQTYNETGLAQSKLWDAGTLCITIAANIADTAILSYPACFPDSIIGFIADESKADTKYVKYCLDTYKQIMLNISLGTTQDNMSATKLLSLKFPVPNLNEQKKIAAILSSYDDLIEINKKHIQTLGCVAEELYKEWFMRFRFPDYECIDFEKNIPKEWEVISCNDLLEVIKGKSYTSLEMQNEKSTDNKFFINLKNFHKYGGYRANGLKYYSGRYADKQKVYQGDIVMAVTDMTQDRAIVGRVARIPFLDNDFGVISLDTVKIVPKKYSNNFIYCYLMYSGFADTIKEFANGANVLHLNPIQILKQDALMPPLPLTEAFDEIVLPIFEQIEKLTLYIENLEIIKQSLQPRLISGKLSVKDLDIQFPPSMQNNES